MLREHVAQRHPDQQFTFLCTDDQTNEQRLEDMLNRSISFNQSLDSTPSTSVSGTRADDNDSPFVVSVITSPYRKPKQELIDVEQIESNSSFANSSGVETLAETEKPDIKSNFSIFGDFRCATCQEPIRMNLMLIRDHVKLHFKEKTGCVPADLTQLLPNLQQVYCQLLITSFPSVAASILNDDMQNLDQTTNQNESRDSTPPSADVDSTWSDYECKGCGEKFRRLASLKNHVTNVCKLNNDKEDQKTTTHESHMTKSRHGSPIGESSTVPEVSCDVCEKKFHTLFAMQRHRYRKHGISVRWYCNSCKLEINSGYSVHLLREHLHKREYECSLCGYTRISPKTINNHDREIHGGLGKALLVYNPHGYKSQIEQLRQQLLIDLNSSSSAQKLATNSKHRKSEKFGFPEISLKRNAQVKAKTNSLLSCEICNKTASSVSILKNHRAKKHGLYVKWYCKQCNMKLMSGKVNTHLLTVHLSRTNGFACSLCEERVVSDTMDDHDKEHHGGEGKAVIVNTMHHYKEQLEALRKQLIIDLSSNPGKEPSSHKSMVSKLKKSKRSKLTGNYASIKAKTANQSCEICNRSFSSINGKWRHKRRKHGIKLHCKQCNIDIEVKKYKLDRHLLKVHLGKNMRACSICGLYVDNRFIDDHDLNSHNGMGKARVIYNVRRYRKEIDHLCDTLIIDSNDMVQNSSETKSISCSNLRKPKTISHEQKRRFDGEKSSEDSKRDAKLVNSESNPIVSCGMCDETFTSIHGIKTHRRIKHGLLVKYHCKHCNINIVTKLVDVHLLRVHLGKKLYVCNLCDMSVGSKIDAHDVRRHNGFGMAQAVYNIHRCRKEIDLLRNTLIIDLNAMEKSGNSAEKKSDNLNWLARFKRSRNRKQRQHLAISK